jgi:hypothetical protein
VPEPGDDPDGERDDGDLGGGVERYGAVRNDCTTYTPMRIKPP